MKEHPAEPHREQIDSTLHLIGSATPRPGFEARILVRLDDARARGTTAHWFSFPQLAVGVAATMLGGAVIIVGSINHSRRMLPIAPGIHLPIGAQSGVGAASAAHVAAHPVTALPQGRPRSVRKTVKGRAVISSDAKKHAGVAVPKRPATSH